MQGKHITVVYEHLPSQAGDHFINKLPNGIKNAAVHTVIISALVTYEVLLVQLGSLKHEELAANESGTTSTPEYCSWIGKYLQTKVLLQIISALVTYEVLLVQLGSLKHEELAVIESGTNSTPEYCSWIGKYLQTKVLLQIISALFTYEVLLVQLGNLKHEELTVNESGTNSTLEYCAWIGNYVQTKVLLQIMSALVTYEVLLVQLGNLKHEELAANESGTNSTMEYCAWIGNYLQTKG
ncbi:hypothetical protein J6590_095433 [Homalodisca vitripennis]|nr:hypothetical protein J6590_095433 [Homalodisca vitripennis]